MFGCYPDAISSQSNLEKSLTDIDKRFWTSRGLPSLAGWTSSRWQKSHAPGDTGHKTALPVRVLAPGCRHRVSLIAHMREGGPSLRRFSEVPADLETEKLALAGLPGVDRNIGQSLAVTAPQKVEQSGNQPHGGGLAAPLTARTRQDLHAVASRKSLNEIKTEALRKALTARHELKKTQKDRLAAVLAAREISRTFAGKNKLVLLREQRQILFHSKLPTNPGLPKLDVRTISGKSGRKIDLSGRVHPYSIQ
ncbi:hypothetical protein TGVAND_222385 [Toxoplasma gondii VAND]|uniref:Uncharacterized protein n=1 Tax=Toxoplasma gondii VAND TaxID=933077 RepID=A0A086PT49_TOXGO|nr:hypothetical protein TGVAND_222385 [Toxoplasma gondii VAND]